MPFCEKGEALERVTDFFYEIKKSEQAKLVPTWLRGPDLNQRPSGYEFKRGCFLSFCKISQSADLMRFAAVFRVVSFCNFLLNFLS